MFISELYGHMFINLKVIHILQKIKAKIIKQKEKEIDLVFKDLRIYLSRKKCILITLLHFVF